MKTLTFRLCFYFEDNPYSIDFNADIRPWKQENLIWYRSVLQARDKKWKWSNLTVKRLQSTMIYKILVYCRFLWQRLVERKWSIDFRKGLNLPSDSRFEIRDVALWQVVIFEVASKDSWPTKMFHSRAQKVLLFTMILCQGIFWPRQIWVLC